MTAPLSPIEREIALLLHIERLIAELESQDRQLETWKALHEHTSEICQQQAAKIEELEGELEGALWRGATEG